MFHATRREYIEGCVADSYGTVTDTQVTVCEGLFRAVRNIVRKWAWGGDRGRPTYSCIRQAADAGKGTNIPVSNSA